MPPYLPDPEDLDDLDDDLLPNEDRIDEYINGHRVVPRNRQYNDRRKQAARQGKHAGDRNRRPNRGNRYTLVPGQYSVSKKKKEIASQYESDAHREELAARAKHFKAMIDASERKLRKSAKSAATTAGDETAALQNLTSAIVEDDPITALVSDFRGLEMESSKPFGLRSKAALRPRTAIASKPNINDDSSEPPMFAFVVKRAEPKPLAASENTSVLAEGKKSGDERSVDRFWKDQASSASTSSSSGSDPYASSSSGEVSSEGDDLRKARRMLDEDENEDRVENFLATIADDVLNPRVPATQSWSDIEELNQNMDDSPALVGLRRIRRTSIGNTFAPKPTFTKGQQGNFADGYGSEMGEDAGEDVEEAAVDDINMEEWDLLEEEVAAWKGDGYDADDEYEMIESPASTAWPTADNGKGRRSWARWLGFRSNDRAV